MQIQSEIVVFWIIDKTFHKYILFDITLSISQL